MCVQFKAAHAKGRQGLLPGWRDMIYCSISIHPGHPDNPRNPSNLVMNAFKKQAAEHVAAIKREVQKMEELQG